jgi:predicted DNA-binding protein (UPF0251 family)
MLTENLTVCAKFLHRNYIRLVDCKKGFCMVIVNELGRLLLEQGWSQDEITELGYAQKEEEEDEYYQDDGTTITSAASISVTESSLEEMPVTEDDLPTFSTESLSDIMADMLVSDNSTTTMWEDVTSAGQKVAEIISEGWESVANNVTISEGWESVANNVTEYSPGFNSTDDYSESFSSRARDPYCLSMPSALRLSTLFITASAVILLASKY